MKKWKGIKLKEMIGRKKGRKKGEIRRSGNEGE